MAASNRADWLILSGLIALAVIPVVAGVVRLRELTGAGLPTPDNARFFAAPLAVVLHIASGTLYSLLGAFQFAPGFRSLRPEWHRAAGCVLVVAGLVAALSGLWMAMFYAIVPADSPLLHAFRLFFGSAMALSIVLGILAIRRRDVFRHQAWMRRAYAIGLGAGTQALTQLPLLLLFGAPNELTLALMMGAAWLVNIAVAESLIRKARVSATRAAAPHAMATMPRLMGAGGADRFPCTSPRSPWQQSYFYPGIICDMDQAMPITYTAFLDGRRLATGPLHAVAVAVLRAQQAQPEGQPLVLSNASGQSTDLDLRGGEEAVATRYTVAAPTQAPKGRGRPKLGVVAREVTLLPEHWEWLAAQPGGASVVLRKLVHEARRAGSDRDRTRQARDRAYHAMSTLAGDLAGFEEASRALFAGDHEQLVAQMAAWPQDVQAYVQQLAEPAPD